MISNTMPPAAPPAPAASPPGDRLDWHLVPTFMLRVGGLPFDTADALASPATAAWADRVLDARQRLAEHGARLSDVLEEQVARRLDDPGARRTLINLRRAVFNGRVPRGLDDAGPLLPPGERDALRAWADEREEYAALLADGSAVVAGEIDAARRELRRIALETDLRYGVQLSSPSLDAYLDDYLRRPPDRPLSKRERRIERSLQEYLYRTACKTSPFSTLTAVSVGRFTDAAGQALAATSTGWHKRSGTRLNVAVLARLSELLQATPEVRQDLPLRATSGLDIDTDRVRYLRKLRGSEGNADAAVTLDQVHESLFYLPAGEVLTDILALFADGAELRYGEAVRKLCAMGPNRPEHDVDAYLAQLLRLGLIVVPGLRTDIHDPDPVRTYHRGLRTLATGWAEDIAALVERMAADADEFAHADLARRRALLSQVKQTVADAHRRLGREDTPVLRTLVYEDTTLPGLDVTGDARMWTEQLTPGLRRLARILPAFDSNLVRRLVTKGYFTTRYGKGGSCPDFLEFAHEFTQDIYDNYSQRLMRHRRFDGTILRRYDNWFRQDEIAGIDRARGAVAEEIRLRYEHAAADGGAGDVDIDLDEGFLTAVEEQLGRPPRGLRPLSFFLQLAQEGTDDPLVVVNRVYSGLTLLFSRFAHLFDAGLTGELRRALDAVVPSGAVFAELKGGYDATNLNLHPAVTPYEVVCPGETSFRPPHEQIPVEDLVVEHDAATDRLRLRSRRLGVEVIPVYLGFLLPMALPEVQQVLLNFSCTSMAPLDLWEGTGLLDDTDRVLPRIRLGNVVLQRRTWRFAADRLPPVVTGQPDEEWFLAWRAWQRAAGLPRHVFAGLGGEHKPQYVDFDAYPSVRLLDTAARKSGGTVVLTEMLPGPEGQWLSDGPHRYVTELTIELDGRDTQR